MSTRIGKDLYTAFFFMEFPKELSNTAANCGFMLVANIIDDV
jgi:hypothetical protein